MSFRESMIALKQQIKSIDDKKHRRTLRLKRKLFMKQRGRCCFCNQKMYACSYVFTSCEKHRIATIEHVIPKCMLRKGESGVYALSCQRCNHLRNIFDFELFKTIASLVAFDKLPQVVKSKKAIHYTLRAHGLQVPTDLSHKRRPALCN